MSVRFGFSSARCWRQYSSCSEIRESSVNLRSTACLRYGYSVPPIGCKLHENGPDRISCGLEEEGHGFACHQFQWSCKAPLYCSCTICSKSTGNGKNLMFSAGLAESKCSRLFLSPDMRVRGVLCWFKAQPPSQHTNVTPSSKRFDSLNINLQKGGKPSNKTNKHKHRRLFQVTFPCYRSALRGQCFLKVFMGEKINLTQIYRKK